MMKSRLEDVIPLWTAAPADITIVDDPGGVLRLRVPKEITGTLTPNRKYYIDVEVTKAGGNADRDTPVQLSIWVDPDVATH
jgi:hypothetical protein